MPFWRAVEACERACADPSNCPPRTRDTFEQAIQLERPSGAAAGAASPPCAPAPAREVGREPAPRPAPALTAGPRGPRLGDITPVLRESVTTVTRTLTRVVTPGMPGRFIDLFV